MSESIVIPFVRDDSLAGADEYWLHLEQVFPDSEVATLGAVAEVVDATFGVDPCSGSEGVPLVTDTPVTTAKEDSEATTTDALAYLNSVIQDIANLSLCDSAISGYPSGSYKAQIKIGKSHQEEDYRLHLSNGKVLSTVIVKEPFVTSYEIEEALSMDLPFPATTPPPYFEVYYRFESVVMGPYGYQTAPVVERNGRALSWGGTKVTGILYVSYYCIYDLVDVVVYGDGSGNAGECEALCFYHGLVEELSIQEPEDTDVTELEKNSFCSGSGGGLTPSTRIHNVTCYMDLTTNYECRCSPGSIHHTVKTQPIVSCDANYECLTPGSLASDTWEAEDGSWNCSFNIGSNTVLGGYVSCGDTIFTDDGNGQLVGSETDEEQVISEDWYYKDKCCHDPEGALPQCQVMRASNPGHALDEDVLKALTDKWGKNLSIIPVSPADGDCGYIETEINIPQLNCCDGAAPLEINKDDSSVVLADDAGGVVLLTQYTSLQITVSISGDGFFTDDDRRSKTAEYYGGSGVLVYTGSACGQAVITITDGCSTVTHRVSSTNGQWSDIEDDDIYLGQAVALTGLPYTDVEREEGGIFVVSGSNYQFKQWEAFGRTTAASTSGDCNYIVYEVCCEEATCQMGTIGTHANFPCYAKESVFSNREWHYCDICSIIPPLARSCYCTCISGHTYQTWEC